MATEPQKKDVCDHCHLTFGLAEDRKRTPGGHVYHISCYGKVIMQSFRQIGGVSFN